MNDRKTGITAVFSGLAITFFSTSLIAQSLRLDESASTEITPGIYREKVVENFEQDRFSGFRLENSSGQDSAIFHLNQNRPPLPETGRYIGWLLKKGTNGQSTMLFANPPEITGYCRSLSLWVFGMDQGGFLHVSLRDSRGNDHQLSFGTLRFRGWKKLSVPVPDHVNQDGLTINRPGSLKVTRLTYHPGQAERMKKWQILFIDELTASVRDKFKLKPAGK